MKKHSAKDYLKEGIGIILFIIGMSLTVIFNDYWMLVGFILAVTCLLLAKNLIYSC